MKSDDELRKQYTVTSTPDGMIEFVFTVRETEPESASRVTALSIDDVNKIFDAAPHLRFNVIIDIQAFDKPAVLTNENRKLYTDFAAHPQLKKVAVIGKTGLQTSVTTFMLKLLPNFRHIAWFSNREEAMLWLKS